MLISESHLTAKTHFVFPSYELCFTNHPDGAAHGGAAIIVRSTLAYYEKLKHTTEEIQAASISVKGPQRELTVTAVYCPPKHNLKVAQLEPIFQSLGPCFLAAPGHDRITALMIPKRPPKEIQTLMHI